MAFPFKKMNVSMGESKKPLSLGFDRSLKLEFCGTKITSNAGLLAYRELDEVFGLTQSLAEHLTESRRGKNTQHKLLPLIRQSIYSRLAGFEDVNDVDLLKLDPAIRMILGGRAKETLAASTSEMNRFETKDLTKKENLDKLHSANSDWINHINQKRHFKKLILDMDSSESQTYGRQEGSLYNGYFGCHCYHPLFCFNQWGDLEGTLLRAGNVHSANRWQKVLEPIVHRYAYQSLTIYFRGDAAFGSPELYHYAENNQILYTIRLKANPNLYEAINHLLIRPRPSHQPTVFYYSFRYQAASWCKVRRVVAKVEWHEGELFPKVGFIITNLKWSSKNVIKFYNKRGTAEQWIKEGKNAIKWTKLSCKRFVANEVRLLLFAMAYNLGNFIRTLVLPKQIAHWSLTTLREKLIKLGAKITKHAHYIRFQLAEFMVSGKLFGEILRNIHQLKFAPG